MRIFKLLSAVLMIAVVALPVHAGGKNAAELVTTCAACHGANGISNDPQYPHLAGQHASFIERALLDYQSGKRKNPIMGGQVANLSEAEISAIAKYYEKLSGPLHAPDAQ